MGWHARVLIETHDAVMTGGGGGGGDGDGGGVTSTATLFTLDDPRTTTATNITTTTTATTPLEEASLAVAATAAVAWGSYLTTLCDLLHQRLSSLADLFRVVQGGQIHDDQGSSSGSDGNSGSSSSGGHGSETIGSGSGSGSGNDHEQLTNTPLCHGVLLAIRYCLIDLHGTRGHHHNPTLWREINQR